MEIGRDSLHLGQGGESENFFRSLGYDVLVLDQLVYVEWEMDEKKLLVKDMFISHLVRLDFNQLPLQGHNPLLKVSQAAACKTNSVTLMSWKTTGHLKSWQYLSHSSHRFPTEMFVCSTVFLQKSSIAKTTQECHDPQHFLCFASIKQDKISRTVNYSHLSLLKFILSLSCFSTTCVVYIFIYLDGILCTRPKALMSRLRIMYWKNRIF